MMIDPTRTNPPRKSQVRILTASLLVLSMVVAQHAFAQEPSRAFSANTFIDAPGHGSFLTVEGASVNEKLSLHLGMMFNYEYMPIRGRICQEVDGNSCSDWGENDIGLIEHRLMGELQGAFALYHIFEVGVGIPAVLYQAGDDVNDPGSGAGIDSPGSAAGLKDIRLHLKLDVLHGIFGYDGGKINFNLALVPSMTFPLGNAAAEESFMGDDFLTFHPKVAFGAKIGRVRMGLNAGYLIVREKETYFLTVGSNLSYGAAAEVDIIPRLSGLVELYGQQALASDTASAPLEGALAAKFAFGPGFAVIAGASFGILGGMGTPMVRAIAGLTWTPVLFQDPDGDGLMGAKDKCPQEAEDRDGFLDEDGCPDLDDDGDGIDDKSDDCPKEAEDNDGFQDDDGCPDPDDDGDGIEDGYDTCPRVAEDKDGFQDEDGCPDLDDDGDGIPDENDKCRTEQEVYNGNEDMDGCPDDGDAVAVVTYNGIDLQKPIEFKGRSARMKNQSLEVLDVLVSILKNHKKLIIRIEGHSFLSRSRQKNTKRSLIRAEAVLRYLVEHGIDPDRLEALGQGPSFPIHDDKSAKSRAANERIEFHVVESEPVEQEE